jgi:hypothetical protein
MLYEMISNYKQNEKKKKKSDSVAEAAIRIERAQHIATAFDKVSCQDNIAKRAVLGEAVEVSIGHYDPKGHFNLIARLKGTKLTKPVILEGLAMGDLEGNQSFMRMNRELRKSGFEFYNMRVVDSSSSSSSDAAGGIREVRFSADIGKYPCSDARPKYVPCFRDKLGPSVMH